MKTILLLFSLISFASAQSISGERIRAHVKFLSSDLLEGRGVGVRGGDLATEYISAQFALAGAKPSGDHCTYLPKVPPVGVPTAPRPPPSALRAPGRVGCLPLAVEFLGIRRPPNR